MREDEQWRRGRHLGQIVLQPLALFIADFEARLDSIVEPRNRLHPLRRRETVELVSAYYKIEDPALRRRFFELARALGGGTERVSGK